MVVQFQNVAHDLPQFRFIVDAEYAQRAAVSAIAGEIGVKLWIIVDAGVFGGSRVGAVEFPHVRDDLGDILGGKC